MSKFWKNIKKVFFEKTPTEMFSPPTEPTPSQVLPTSTSARPSTTLPHRPSTQAQPSCPPTPPPKPHAYISTSLHQAFIRSHTLPPLTPLERAIIDDDFIAPLPPLESSFLDQTAEMHTPEAILSAFNNSFGTWYTMDRFEGMLHNAWKNGVLKKWVKDSMVDIGVYYSFVSAEEGREV
ncbi:hypothetical protein GLAREA_09596 [Glarea lozoyensis ATCC 20868]|uniref:Uncharacterized protein n=1 Tax=Glarea lozoyensis (strain ATCC 20868 / MF5171) TaxID=1116229 RepID=S3CS20_GLAL2|nr:uncharacterized protein GLAREA_09596 [Glarea lozoyensis ATCC 20868]EPE28475.1 hypothetical protein GLAREA_09596 [Glarea lozoyensis ATCC 20868]